MQTLMLKLDRVALAETLFDHSFVIAYNSYRNVRLVTHYQPEKHVGDGKDKRFEPDGEGWTLDEVVMPLKAVVRHGDSRNWEMPAPSLFEVSLAEFVVFEREIVKGPCVKREGAVYWQTWNKLPLYRDGAFDAFRDAVHNLEGLAELLRKQRQA